MKSCHVRIDRFAGMTEMEVSDEITVTVGEYVVGEFDKGPCLCVIMTEPQDTQKEGLKKVIRRPADEEVSQYFSLKEGEPRAFEFCKEKIKQMGLSMKLLFAEYLFGGTKLLFYFVSESRVDFRELVKELAKEFKIRIELRQVGVRDEAKIVGGLGNCGNVCCCKRFLNNFSIVSIKMVKEQGLALNPAKISGICGRLMCCLSYEYDMYVGYKKGFPKLGKRIKISQGEGKVVKHNTLTSTFTVELDDGKEITVQAKDILQ
ncbi:PSP1 domain-containing protein [Syntrophorhabdus aromaticivorans]|jgi:cell fate regulator YaaT (PSP1 superfamily)|uniref:Stage 0 sporulation protein n=1 Tax=Syntrophorhabdus aromaticivorans TaxID=328301 RepID=A0A351U4R9_9BACT|nr:regulatory iron-sulfur-containing complex subunit RicT [Syntrophorhabdus aromaticivorans]NLW35881.1 stage 0 sporulation protein [Syntrophorhabdus aromaticivorans]HBA54950.1 stage 0 sporulation protein [Syntrophorhabdus aromaticivorans]